MQGSTIKASLLGVVLFFVSSCFSTANERDFTSAKRAEAQEDFIGALSFYEKVFLSGANKERVLESARAIAEISQTRTKDYAKAVKYLKFVIANSPNFSLAYAALSKKAFIEHKLLYYYEDAIKSYQRLLSYDNLPLAEITEIRLNMARCFYAIHDYSATKTELRALLSPSQNAETQFTAKLLEASVLQTEGQTEAAIQRYKEATTMNVSNKQKTDAFMSLALCYEQKEDYQHALEAIKKITHQDDFLKLKTTQLERLAMFQKRRLSR